jgi:hypothetical protein
LNLDLLGWLLVEIGVSNPSWRRFEDHGPSLDELSGGRKAVEISLLVFFDIRGSNPCCLTLVERPISANVYPATAPPIPAAIIRF